MKKKPRSPFRPASRALALEPRLLFDGAGAVAAVDNFDMAGDHHAEVQKQDTQPAAEARPSEVMEKTPGGGTLLIIDSRVADFQSLLADLPANVTVRIVEADESGINAVGMELARGGKFDAVHIVSHGTPGSFALGSDVLDGSTIDGHAAQLQAWAQYLTADADLLLYGCDIAQGEAGQAFVDRLATLTGADVAASIDATGAAAKGGNWVLESRTGSIEADLAFSQSVMAAYGELMAAPTVKDTTASKSASVAEDTDGEVGKGITVTGTGADSLSVTVGVAKGTLSATTYSGTAAQVQAWLAGLTYTYTGASQTGDSDTLTIDITNTTNGGSTQLTRAIAITPENDAPQVSTGGIDGNSYVKLKVAEGGDVTFAAVTTLIAAAQAVSAPGSKTSASMTRITRPNRSSSS